MFKKRDSAQYASDWQVITLGMTIPLLLGAGPIVGIYLGQWIGGLFHYAEPGSFIGLLIGFAAGIRETVHVVKRLMLITNNKK